MNTVRALAGHFYGVSGRFTGRSKRPNSSWNVQDVSRRDVKSVENSCPGERQQERQRDRGFATTVINSSGWVLPWASELDPAKENAGRIKGGSW